MSVTAPSLFHWSNAIAATVSQDQHLRESLVSSPRANRAMKISTRLAFFTLVATLLNGQNGWAEYADVILNNHSEAAEMRPVIFPHWFHRIRFRCKVCHSELGFEMRVGSNNITMEKIITGQYCGMCHNGDIAWSVEQCGLCHSGKKGLKTGIRSGHQSGGPGRY